MKNYVLDASFQVKLECYLLRHDVVKSVISHITWVTSEMTNRLENIKSFTLHIVCIY
jgi:hypothetical protein